MNISSNVEGTEPPDQQSGQQAPQQPDMQSNPADNQMLFEQASQAKAQLIKNGFTAQEAEQIIQDRIKKLKGGAQNGG
jgi:hypothetical protein